MACNMVVHSARCYFYFSALTSILVNFNDTSLLGHSSTCRQCFLCKMEKNMMIISADVRDREFSSFMKSTAFALFSRVFYKSTCTSTYNLFIQKKVSRPT